VLKLLHISDLHFGPPYLPHVGEALLRIAPVLAPEVIVASGDFTQRAKPEQFAEARAFLEKLPQAPIVRVPGNHDVPLYRVWDRLSEPHALYREYISEDLNTVTTLDGAVIVALDSSAPRRAITNGRIREEQLQFCEQAMRDAPEEALRIFVAHHHLAPAPDYEREQVLPGAKRILERLVRMHVDVVLGGHLHRAYIGNSLDVYSGNDRDRGLIIVQCGTTTSRRGRVREREKNTFNLVELDREMVRVTHFMYFDEDDQFGPVSRHFFPRPGRRFVEPGSGNVPPMPTTEV
jgi:3',5'-cyclic AMP phosphodiesterase CpdA